MARAVVVFGCLCVAASTAAQSLPSLNNDQRGLLTTLLAAVDAAPPAAEAVHDPWQTHILRASDGSHYVAFSVASSPAAPISADRVLIYVRLSRIPESSLTTVAARSSVREWLDGSRIDPRLVRSKRGFAVGSMPAMGAATAGGGGAATVGSADLQIMGLQRERERQRKEQEERERKASLEAAGPDDGGLLPFEDFDVVAPPRFADGTAAIQRALTAGPGRYRLSVAWVDAAAKPGKAPVHVTHQTLDLPPAWADEFRISSVIVAESVRVRETPYTAAEQRSHPYAIGPTEVVPARDATFTPDDSLSLAFQVINARATPSGKPDVTVNFRITRLVGSREQQVAALTPLRYGPATLPSDFDIRLGHPIIAGMAVPLTTISRGDYRLHITAIDHTTTTSTSTHTDFRVVGTPLSLLREAPPLGPPFRREALVERTLAAVVQALTPAAPSAALRRALDAAAAGKFAELLFEEAVPPGEQGHRAALTALALLTIGDGSAAGHGERALAAGAPAGPANVLIGALRATQNRDAEAIAAWQAAIAGGMPSAVVAPFLVDALLRRGDAARAASLITTEVGSGAPGAWARALAATHLAAGRDAQALTVLDTHLAQASGDVAARWLQLQALYGSIVRGNGGDRDRFRRLAEAYVAASSPHASLAAEWLKAVP
ncbi:MAG: hypothetical protein AB7N29_15165 [Vicinamibacterales bacterium]